ncbi:MAG: Jag N-terminal domain-containing protein [Epsilonproteobacteria bacterium]|nr:Jag N-terminal domain-containing protein [Campylobacterota bacterium]
MKKVEAPTLEAAYAEASKVLECSISELQCEVVQHSSKGILGFLKKNAIIVATCKKVAKSVQKTEKVKEKISTVLPTEEESVASEIIATVKDEVVKVKPLKKDVEVSETVVAEKDAVLDSFFEADKEEIIEEEDVVYDELALLIENQLKELLEKSCFDIDVVEVDVVDNTALIFIDGEDAALIIGKEGYRYNALSYMIFNWLHTKYELFIKLEIAEFLTTQQEMMRNYIKPVIENVEKQGKGKTRFLDGILVQIALEQLRERFPDKYVAVKTGREGKKFVVINEFNNPSKSHH